MIAALLNVYNLLNVHEILRFLCKISNRGTVNMLLFFNLITVVSKPSGSTKACKLNRVTRLILERVHLVPVCV